jgi:acyl carrier protein
MAKTAPVRERPHTDLPPLHNKIVDILSRHLQRDDWEFTAKTRFSEDLEADSLDFIEMIMLLEEEFNVAIPDVDAEKLLTVGDVFKYMDKAVKTCA